MGYGDEEIEAMLRSQDELLRGLIDSLEGDKERQDKALQERLAARRLRKKKGEEKAADIGEAIASEERRVE